MTHSNQLEVRRALAGEIIEAGKWKTEYAKAPTQELQEIVQTLRVEHHHYNHQVQQPPAPRPPEMIQRRPNYEMQMPHGVVTVQQTSKFWKGVQFGGALGAIVGALLFFFGAMSISSDSGAPVGMFIIGLLMTPAGLAMYVFGRIGAWWCHG